MTTVLLTGGSGYVGEAILRALLARGVTVVALTNRTVLPELPLVRQLPMPLESSVLPSSLRGLGRIDAIVHAAGIPKFLGGDPTLMRRVHVDATRCLVDEAARRAIPLLHISTAFVTGPPGDVLPEGPPALAPAANLYEETKTAAERMIAERASEACVEVLRPAIVVPAEGEPLRNLRRSPLGAFVQMAMRRPGDWRLVGDPDTQLAWTCRWHFAQLVARLATGPAHTGVRWWNILAPGSPTLGEVAALVEDGDPSPCYREAAGRAAPWEPYLRSRRRWETSGTDLRLARLGLPAPPVSSSRLADAVRRLLRGHSGEVAA
jgi:nucleoside-diphosphate-sugar epimerase